MDATMTIRIGFYDEERQYSEQEMIELYEKIERLVKSEGCETMDGEVDDVESGEILYMGL